MTQLKPSNHIDNQNTAQDQPDAHVNRISHSNDRFLKGPLGIYMGTQEVLNGPEYRDTGVAGCTNRIGRRFGRGHRSSARCSSAFSLDLEEGTRF